MSVRSEVMDLGTAVEEIWQQPSTLPSLPANAIYIWRLRPEDRLATQDYIDFLQPEERDRASRLLSFADQQQSIASRGTLRLLLAYYASTNDPRDLRLAHGEQGKPYLAGTLFSKQSQRRKKIRARPKPRHNAS